MPRHAMLDAHSFAAGTDVMWQRFKILLVFVLLGPLIGGWVACPIVLGCAALGNDARDMAGMLAALPLCALYGPLFGYFLGAIPAAAAGLLLAVAKPEPTRRHLRRVSLLSAALAFVMCGFLMIGRAAGADDASGSVLITAAATIAGLVAGNVCWRVVSRPGAGSIQAEADGVRATEGR